MSRPAFSDYSFAFAWWAVGLGPAYAFFLNVKRAVYKADGSNGGFISATLAPVDRKPQRAFGALEAIIIVGLIVGTVGLMRYLLAH